MKKTVVILLCTIFLAVTAYGCVSLLVVPQDDGFELSYFISDFEAVSEGKIEIKAELKNKRALVSVVHYSGGLIGASVRRTGEPFEPITVLDGKAEIFLPFQSVKKTIKAEFSPEDGEYILDVFSYISIGGKQIVLHKQAHVILADGNLETVK
ncbi:MAG: hypothetical protein LBP62_06635 [Clostridiales bacterium]|jgi:hypothetical protein|nr:hypothetical protein [Clostridiales bacterium]